jgi:hypothetical protein
MKKTLLLSLIVMTILVACGPTPKQAAEYNDKIMDIQFNIVQSIDKLNETYQFYIPTEMDAAWNKSLEVITKGIETVTAMEKFDGKTEYKDAALEFFKAYKGIIETEHKEMVNIYKIPDENFTEQHLAQWDKLFEQADSKMEVATEKFGKIQDEFAKKYKLDLQ